MGDSQKVGGSVKMKNFRKVDGFLFQKMMEDFVPAV
jgi:hypothetical protein